MYSLYKTSKAAKTWSGPTSTSSLPPLLDQHAGYQSPPLRSGKGNTTSFTPGDYKTSRDGIQAPPPLPHTTGVGTAPLQSSSPSILSKPGPSALPSIPPAPAKSKMTEEEKKQHKADLEAMTKQADDLIKLIKDTENMLKAKVAKSGVTLPQSKTSTQSKMLDILKGRVPEDVTINDKIVRIFTSSTFTDTGHERNTLMEHVYPKLKDYCRDQGYEFQVVDMRWGIREEASNDHTTIDICLQELAACQRLSTGPNFVTFLSHKYGYRPIPKSIEAVEFDKLKAKMDNERAKEFLRKWYKRDDNSVPPAYTLQPISTHYSDYLSTDTKKFKSAKIAWYEEHDLMQDALARAAEVVIDDPVTREKYSVSVSETEIQKGILQADDVNKHCVWFRRNIDDIEQQPESKILGRYFDSTENTETGRKTREMWSRLTNDKMKTTLNQENIFDYHIKWYENGVDPSTVPEHKAYIDNLCKDFEVKLKEMIDIGIKEKAVHQHDVYDEVLEHSVFARQKCDSFHGRGEIIKAIEDYVNNDSRLPFIVHGESGCGKTSIMAMASKAITENLKQGVIMLRFIGTTPHSSNIRSLLLSMNDQLTILSGAALGRNPIIDKEKNNKKTLKEVLKLFNTLLKLAPRLGKVVIFLDSLDQLDPSHDGLKLDWLPKELPPKVKIVLSTLPDEKYVCLPLLKKYITDEEQYLNVPRIDENDVTGIVNKWLNKAKRKLTDDQLQVVMNAFSKTPLPLFLKLCFDEAVKWTSYDINMSLPKDIKEIIKQLFEQVEKKHGQILTSRLLGYMTLSRNGLSENELEDILSCDDEVLNDVYQFWVPPVRRLPPLLIVRIKTELGQYLVDRGVDGVKVFYWYHRQFIEAARLRYCSDKELNKTLHRNIAEYFLGSWADGKEKPYTDKEGNQQKKNRVVSSQPIKFESSINARKLMELPPHLVEAGMLGELKNEVIFNLNWMVAKIQAFSYLDLMDDIALGSKAIPGDQDIELLQATLQISQDALNHDGSLLPGQLIGRLTQGLDTLKAQCQTPPYPALIPSKQFLEPPGGNMKFVLAGHDEDIDSIVMTSDSKLAVSFSGYGDKTLKVWDVEKGRMIRNIEDVKGDGMQILCDKYIAVYDYEVTLYKIDTGEKVVREWAKADTGQKRQGEISVCGPNNNTLVYLYSNILELQNMDTETKTCIKVWEADDKDRHFSSTVNVASAGTEILCVAQDHHIVIVNLTKMELQAKYSPLTAKEIKDMTSIDGLAITSDDKIAALKPSIKEHEIRLFDIENDFARLKLIKLNDACHFFNKLRFLPDNVTLWGHCGSDDAICVLNIQTKNKCTIAPHVTSLVGACTFDLKTIVTATYDKLVRIWKFEEGVSEKLKKSEEAFKADNKSKDLTNCKIEMAPGGIFGDGIAVVKLVDKADKQTKNYLCLYDVNKGIFIRKWFDKEDVFSRLTNTGPVMTDHKTIFIGCPHNGDKEQWTKVKEVDLELLKVTRIFPTRLTLGGRHSLVNNNTELVCQTYAKRKFKIINIESGKVTQIFTRYPATEQDLWEDFRVEGNILIAALEDDGPFFSFDVKTRQCLHEIRYPKAWDPDPYYSIDGECQWLDNGKYIVNIGNKVHTFTRPGQVKPTKLEGVQVPYTIDLVKGEMIRSYGDPQAQSELKSDTMEIDCFTLAMAKSKGKYKVLASCDDRKLRIYDFETEKLEATLWIGSSIEFSRSFYDNDEEYVITNSSSEQIITVIDLISLSVVASFKVDTMVKAILASNNGRTIHAFTHGEFIQLNVHDKNGPPKQLPYKDATLYPGVVLDGIITDGFKDELFKIPEDDMDSEEPPPESEYEDSEEEDYEVAEDEDDEGWVE